MPASKQDEAFVRQALELAHYAARALEEAYQYVEDIKDRETRQRTEREVERIVEFL